MDSAKGIDAMSLVGERLRPGGRNGLLVGDTDRNADEIGGVVGREEFMLDAAHVGGPMELLLVTVMDRFRLGERVGDTRDSDSIVRSESDGRCLLRFSVTSSVTLKLS